MYKFNVGDVVHHFHHTKTRGVIVSSCTIDLDLDCGEPIEEQDPSQPWYHLIWTIDENGQELGDDGPNGLEPQDSLILVSTNGDNNCSFGQLTSIDVSNNCSFGQLTSIDVSNNYSFSS